jgi:hypothetical protein
MAQRDPTDGAAVGNAGAAVRTCPSGASSTPRLCGNPSRHRGGPSLTACDKPTLIVIHGGPGFDHSTMRDLHAAETVG